MAYRTQDLVRTLSPRRILIPIAIGLIAVSFMLYGSLGQERFVEMADGSGTYVWVDLNEDGDTQSEEFFKAEAGGTHALVTYREVLAGIEWTGASYFWMFIALIMMMVRDGAYMYRIRLLTDNLISWRKSFDVIMLWEFASAISPSVIGGTAVALFILNKEGVNAGKSTSIVFITALLDELFYVIIVPVMLLLVGTASLFPVAMEMQVFGRTLGTAGIFVMAYLILAAYSLLLIYGIFMNPRGFKWLIIKVFSLPLLRKWRPWANRTGDEMLVASTEFKGRPLVFWMKAYVATVLSWTARFWVVNFIILAFTPVGEHMLIYARQLVMWSILLLTPTPGGSGFAEFAFSGFFHDFIPVGLAASLALIWRLISYYPYLFIGTVVLPRWLKRVFQ
jgi:glycosyltransferase 2 family protein